MNLSKAKRIVARGKIAYGVLSAYGRSPTANEELLFEACDELEAQICRHCKNWTGECGTEALCDITFSAFK